MQGLHHNDVAYQGFIDYHPQPLASPAYVFPDVGNAQDVPVQIQPNAPVGFFLDTCSRSFTVGESRTQPLWLCSSARCTRPFSGRLPRLFAHRVPTPDPTRPHWQAGAENLRQLSRNYLHHPDAQVRMVTMKAVTAGRIRVVVIFETPDF
ncbi:hypothetical protein BGY98DRAFT_279172 [Russula aff. rugulosa BPL654]|nr:hypothetical protein BGY98DRAFT_279172 [Russula aff. rugulosa BPL654]